MRLNDDLSMYVRWKLFPQKLAFFPFAFVTLNITYTNFPNFDVTTTSHSLCVSFQTLWRKAQWPFASNGETEWIMLIIYLEVWNKNKIVKIV